MGRPERIPRRTTKPLVEEIQEVAVVLWRQRRVLWTQRPDHGRWPAMWEFPHVGLAAKENHEDAAKRLLQQLGLHAQLGRELAAIRHTVTRFRIHLVCLEAVHHQGQFRPGPDQVRGRWLFPHQLDDFPVSAPQRRLVQMLSAEKTLRVHSS